MKGFLVVFIATANVCIAVAGEFLPALKISDGEDTTIDEFPYHVSLMESMEKPLCNGALLDEYWVITSARCVNKYRTTAGLLIRVATSDQENGGNMYPANNVIEHDVYSHDFIAGADNIALVRSSSRILDNNTGHVSLPKPGDELEVGSVVLVTGFGSLNSSMESSEDGSYSRHLQQVNVTVWSHGDCVRAYGSSIIGESMFCAGDDGKGACEGDYGGPAVINGTIYGVYSFGRGCGNGEYPGIYTKVNPYVDWIEEVMSTMT